MTHILFLLRLTKIVLNQIVIKSELRNNVKDNINDQGNESSKSSVTTNRDRFNNDNNTPSDICNNIIVFGDSIPDGINIWNLNTRRTL